MRHWILAALGLISVLGIAAPASAGQRDFAVADHPLSDDVDPGAVRKWPGGVTSRADLRYAALSGWRRLTLDLYLPPRKRRGKAAGGLRSRWRLDEQRFPALWRSG